MDKMKMETVSLTERNIDKVAEMFPNVVTEVKDSDGTVRRAIDFDALKAELSADAVEGRECYEFTWAGKTDAKIEASKSIRKTLRPCKEESKNWDATQNLYIEGDNLDVLKLLQESYLGKVKMIYIDPPYNTGNDFVYADDFRMKRDEYEEMLDLTDDDGNRMIRNPETLGRFHSNWCSMIYSRLKLARNLLTDDGVIFISIDDNEQANLKKICDEIFGAENFISILVWEKKKKESFLSKKITNIKEYVFVYSKDINLFEGLVGEINSSEETYPCINAVNKREKRNILSGIKSKYKEPNYFLPKGGIISDTTMSIKLLSDLVIENNTLSKDLVLESNWRYSQDAMYSFAHNGELYITRDLYLRRIVKDVREKALKDLLPRQGEEGNVGFSGKYNIEDLTQSGWGSNEDADEELRNIFGVQKIIDYPKPVKLILKLLASYRSKENLVILDFFSGSATTADAVMQLNAEDGGNRKFIMVQVPEKCDEKSEAFKAGYENICEIGKERIRRAGEKIVAETGKTDLDIGFRVLKLASTNMKDVYYTPAELTQKLLTNTENNIKDDRTDMDLLYGCLLDWGVELSLPHETKQIDGCAVHFVNRTDLIACFDTNVPETVVRAIAAEKPVRVVFRDSSFKNISDKNNVTEIFKAVSPDTTVKVI